MTLKSGHLRDSNGHNSPFFPPLLASSHFRQLALRQSIVGHRTSSTIRQSKSVFIGSCARSERGLKRDFGSGFEDAPAFFAPALSEERGLVWLSERLPLQGAPWLRYDKKWRGRSKLKRRQQSNSNRHLLFLCSLMLASFVRFRAVK